MYLPKGVYQVRPGLFGLVRYTRSIYEHMKPAYVEWYQCRDSFQYAWRRNRKRYMYDGEEFLFCCRRRNVEEFMQHAEKALGLWRKTTVCTTHVKGICGIRPSPFWSKQEIRVSLMTILLRAAMHYKPGTDWWRCLLGHPYAQETKDAIAYFFSGHTVYKEDVGQHQGWCYVFSPMYGCHRVNDLLRRSRLSTAWRWCKGWIVKT